MAAHRYGYDDGPLRPAPVWRACAGCGVRWRVPRAPFVRCGRCRRCLCAACAGEAREHEWSHCHACAARDEVRRSRRICRHAAWVVERKRQTLTFAFSTARWLDGPARAQHSREMIERAQWSLDQAEGALVAAERRLETARGRWLVLRATWHGYATTTCPDTDHSEAA